MISYNKVGVGKIRSWCPNPSIPWVDEHSTRPETATTYGYLKIQYFSSRRGGCHIKIEIDRPSSMSPKLHESPPLVLVIWTFIPFSYDIELQCCRKPQEVRQFI
jgi:hypothetical protein